MTTPGILVEAGVRGLYKRLDVTVPPSLTERLDNVKTLTPAAMNKLLMEARRHLGKREDLDSGQGCDADVGRTAGQISTATPATSTRETLNYAHESGTIFGNFTGIGVQIRRNNVKDMLQVVTPIIGSPAYKAKMQAGDIITTIVREVDSQGKPYAVPQVISTKGHDHRGRRQEDPRQRRHQGEDDRRAARGRGPAPSSSA